MVTDEQVRLLRKKMAEGKTIPSAAAAAGMSERSAHTWKKGALPSETETPRTWRTRPDPFAAIWETDVVPLLESDGQGVLEGTSGGGPPDDERHHHVRKDHDFTQRNDGESLVLIHNLLTIL